MAKVRAYKLAEELKLDREELVSKARELGIDIRSAMSSLEDEQVELLRRRLGQASAETHTEKRVGQQVIRRRRKIVEEAPEPIAAEPEPVAEEPVAPEPEPVLVVEPEPVTEPELEPEEAPIQEPAAVEVPEPLAAAAAAPAPTADQVDRAVIEEAIREEEGPSRVARPGEGRRVPARPVGKRPAKREANEAANLREQDTLARSMLGNVQRRMEQRRMIVEQQARLQPKRRRAAAAGQRAAPSAARKDRTVRLPGEMTLAELSRELGVKVRDLLRQGRSSGLDLDRDARVDFETAALLAGEFQFEAQPLRRDIEETLEQPAASVSDTDRPSRPPVVTVMGHVDHGKTSLLDYIRQTKVTEGEAGGITQHIGAYTVHREGGEITFLDTPGHAAFTQMRARGAQVTDIVVLVVAADDGVMPQTIEAINHARAARVPIIVAINKIDKADAVPQRVKQGLLEQQIVLEEFGGDVIGVEVSATKGTQVDKLLEMITLQAEVLELRARTQGPARGTVIEAQLDKGRGPVATILVREGTLRRGDAFVIGSVSGRVRSLIDDTGSEVKQAPPAMPVQIVGLSSVPEAGEELIVAKNEREAKQIALHREGEARRQAADGTSQVSADDLFASMSEGEERELRVVLKADVHGTMEAIRDAIEKGSTEKVKATVIHSGVGAISENDVTFASASRAVVVGFHVVPEPAARRAAEVRGVEMRTFNIVYELLDDVRALMQGLLPPKITEQIRGRADVRDLFTIPRIGTIAGCYVASGAIRRSDSVRVIRDGVPIYSGKIQSLRRFKDDAREVTSGMECGIHVERFNDVKVGDVLETFVLEETRETL
jgi:translation initiation factor IF-2